jgi:hemimethylated DNA binding protein
VLVHDNPVETYVAERNLEADHSGRAVNHPQLGNFFSELHDGKYIGSRPH